MIVWYEVVIESPIQSLHPQYNLNMAKTLSPLPSKTPLLPLAILTPTAATSSMFIHLVSHGSFCLSPTAHLPCLLRLIQFVSHGSFTLSPRFIHLVSTDHPPCLHGSFALSPTVHSVCLPRLICLVSYGSFSLSPTAHSLCLPRIICLVSTAHLVCLHGSLTFSPRLIYLVSTDHSVCLSRLIYFVSHGSFC
jgi:hypothetical protein